MPVDRKRDAAITALIVAQDAFEDKRGRSHIIGVFDTIGAVGFPVNVSFMIYCRIQGQGAHTAYVKIVDSFDETVVETEPLVCDITPTKGHQWFAGFGVTFNSPQLYKVRAYLDGVLEQEVPVMVREEKAASAGPQ
jgi:hypothetical protein